MNTQINQLEAVAVHSFAPTFFRCVKGFAAAAVLGLAGCGGGDVFVGVGAGFPPGPPPAVSLQVAVAGAPPVLPGDAVTLLAAPDAPNGIDTVSFFRVDPGNVVTLLGTVGGPPPRWNTSIPVNAAYGQQVAYYASVQDAAGLTATSNLVVLTVGL